MFKGAITAIVTPFKNGQFDEAAYRELIEFQVKGGVHGIVPCGTTGESPTLSHAEHKRVVETCIDQVKKRVVVIAGSGSNNTAEALELTQHAQQAGADAALMITPYYNKPTQEGLFQHYKTVASQTKIPIVVYNVPGRTSLNLLPETMARLAELPNIVGLKDATGDLKQGCKTLELCGDKITVLSGDDFTTLPLMCVGGMGVISVVSNVVPADMAGMCNAFFAGRPGESPGAPLQDVAPDGGHVHRDQPRPGQDGHEDDGQDHRRGAAAAVPHVRRQRRETARGDAEVWVD